MILLNINNRTRTILADLSLVIIAMIWGISFVFVKVSIGVIPPMEFIGIRFVIASLVLGIIFYKDFLKTSKKEIIAGCFIGVFLFLSFFAQTIGLQYTTPGKSGFITGLYIVIVPFFASLYYKKFVGWLPITGAIIAFSGLGLLSVSSDELYLLGKGDLLTLICAFGYALHILAVENYVGRFNPFVLSAVQIGFTGVLSLLYSLFFEPVTLSIPMNVWGAIAFTALLSTCLGFLGQNVAQKFTSSTHAALLLGLEAPFSLLFSVILWGEVLTFRGFLGCLLIFVAILMIEIGPALWSREKEKEREREVLSEPGSGV
jgi:drug/metabolite transporter (DMT)-like permease